MYKDILLWYTCGGEMAILQLFCFHLYSLIFFKFNWFILICHVLYYIYFSLPLLGAFSQYVPLIRLLYLNWERMYLCPCGCTTM